jgi:hypothetical protein
MEQLWRRQIMDWPVLTRALSALREARTKDFKVHGSRVIAQCNPARLSSASSRVDEKSLANRPCKLCPDQLPDDQRSIFYGDHWSVLCNIAPLFEPHFTVIAREHQPQRLEPALDVLLQMASDIQGAYTVFYNGPRCGASLPDHLHIQAARSGVTPFERRLAVQLCGHRNGNGNQWVEWLRTGHVRLGVTRSKNCRPAVILAGRDQQALSDSLREVIGQIGCVHPADPEPMVNLFVTYIDECWLAWLFPRQAHRPDFYGRDNGRFLISPGAVDMAGLLIVPRPDDFQRLTPEIVQSLYDQVLLPDEQFADLRNRLDNQSKGRVRSTSRFQ